MAKFEALIEDLDKKFFASVYNAAKAASQEIVADLQQRGPSWTGRFSNSWELAEGDIAVSGNRSQGEPLAVILQKAPPNLQKLRATTEIVFRITNLTPQPTKNIALDKIEGTFIHITALPETALGRTKYENFTQGRAAQTKRGAAGTGGPGLSSRTAALDWYSDYLNGGYIPRIIKTRLSATIRRTQ